MFRGRTHPPFLYTRPSRTLTDGADLRSGAFAWSSEDKRPPTETKCGGFLCHSQRSAAPGRRDLRSGVAIIPAFDLLIASGEGRLCFLQRVSHPLIGGGAGTTGATGGLPLEVSLHLLLVDSSDPDLIDTA